MTWRPTDSQGGIDLALYARNRRAFPDEELRRHAGKYVAFRCDGTAIVAAANDPAGLLEHLQRAGLSFEQIVWEYLPAAEEETWL